MSFFKEHQLDPTVIWPGRQKFTRHLYVAGIFFVVIALILCIIGVPSVRKLVIVEQSTGKILNMENVKPGDTFMVSYIHSVNKSPITDVFEIQSDYSIIIKKTIFRSFGAGVPFELEGHQVMNTYDDRIEIDNINRPIDKYLLFVGTIADHTFEMHNKRLHLSELTGVQNTVCFEVRKVSLYSWIKYIRI